MHFYAYLRCRKRQHLTHLAPQGHECVVHARPGAGVEGHVGFGIEGRAAGQDALEVFHGFAAGGHGPHVPLRRHTTHMVRRVGLQPDGVAVRQHQVEVGRVRDQPARCGYDHLRVDLDGLFQRAAFVAAVGVCAVEVVDFADAATGKLFDLAAEFDEGIAQVIVMSSRAVVGMHDLVVHDYGPGRRIISLHAELPSTIEVFEAHSVIDDLENELEEKIGCEAVIHYDPIDTNDEELKRLKTIVVGIVKEIDETLAIHDFRYIPGDTHTNLIFDIVVGYGCEKCDDDLKKQISEEVLKLLPNHYCVIKCDKSYI